MATFEALAAWERDAHLGKHVTSLGAACKFTSIACMKLVLLWDILTYDWVISISKPPIPVSRVLRFVNEVFALYILVTIFPSAVRVCILVKTRGSLREWLLCLSPHFIIEVCHKLLVKVLVAPHFVRVMRSLGDGYHQVYVHPVRTRSHVISGDHQGNNFIDLCRRG